MNTLKILSLNLLVDHAFWNQRNQLIVDEVNRLNPDIIAFQELLLSEKTNIWLSKNFSQYRVYLCPKTYPGATEALALLSRAPVKDHQTLALGSQFRVAQKIGVGINGNTLSIANTHLYFGPTRDKPRFTQAKKLLEWLPQPAIVCGDFNAEPSLPSIVEMKKRFFSAYEVTHGVEPEWTCPTPLKRGISVRHGARHVGLRAAGIIKHQKNVHWHGTIDYIFVDKGIGIKSCDLAFDKPSEVDKKIFPSDHLGLFTVIAPE